MFFLIPTGQTRPSILEKNKDEDYHSKFARYCIGQANNYLHTQWLNKIEKNKRFYKGDQWIETEDVDTFLKDDDNGDRNRLSIVQNIIRPMVEQYRGNAIRMNINFRVKSVSPQSINRREIKLAELSHLTDIANQPENPFGPAMKAKLPIGDSQGETSAIFQNIYVDKLVEDMNYLAKYVSERNKFENKQVTLAFQMAFSGLAVMHDFEYAGHQQFRVIPSDTFFWDRSCREEDLSDASFMGEIQEMFPSEIFEQYQNISTTDREAIENYSRYISGFSANVTTGNQYNNNSISTGRVPVYKVFWRDGQTDEYGYVKDEYGYEYFTKINYTYEGETEPRYTDKDLIKSTSQKAKRLLGDKLKKKLHYDVLRMALIIPKEIIGSADPNNTSNTTYNDILLDWGMAPYQETENLEFNTVKYPYKCATWAYVNGDVLSPMDDAIDPQRMVNRLLSVAENQMNNMGGTGTVIDKDMVDDQSQTARDTNQSKTIFVSARGKGIQNVVGNYDGSRALGNTAGMYQIIESIKSSVKETTGVNDAIQGQATGSGNDQLVGVTQLMIQRGSLMQEPFYNGIVMVFEQCFNSICSRGKRIYADNEREITMAVGDEGATVIRITKEMNLEDFRCFVKRENSDEMLREAANQQLLQFKQLGMLDDKRIANLWGRATPDMVANALREYAAEKEEINRMAEKDNAQQEQTLQAQLQEQEAKQQNDIQEQTAREDIKHLTDKKAETNKTAVQALTKIAPENQQASKLILENAKNNL